MKSLGLRPRGRFGGMSCCWRLGVEGGDRGLWSVSKRVRERLREGSRLGGDKGAGIFAFDCLGVVGGRIVIGL